jgi:hypothetical protein
MKYPVEGFWGVRGPFCYSTSLSYNYLCTYALYSPVHNVLDVCIFDSRVSFGAQKTREFQGPNPLPLPQVMDMHASKNIMHRAV